MTKLQNLALCLAITPATLLAQYNYYYTDAFSSINTSYWTENGSLTASSYGLYSTYTNGGSLIFSGTVPGPAGEYEVAAKLNLNASGGTYVLYLNASNNALSGPSPSGSFYDVELQPTFSGSSCSASLTLNKYVSGVLTTLSSTACSNGMVIRAMHLPYAGSALAVYVSGLLTILAGDSSLTSGSPGVGARGIAYTGNAIAQAQLGQLDTTAPNAFNNSLIGTSSFANRVDVQSPGTTDNSGGTGIAFYQIYRGSTIVANDLPTPNWGCAT